MNALFETTLGTMHLSKTWRKDQKNSRDQNNTLLRAIPAVTLFCHSFRHLIWKYIWHVFSDILFWQSIWHFVLTFFLASLLAFYVAFYDTLFLGILSDIYSALLSGIYSDILSAILSGILSGTYSDILSAILSGISSDSFLASIWHLFWYSIWQSIWHSLWQSLWRSLWHVFGPSATPQPLSSRCVTGPRAAPQPPELGTWTPQPRDIAKCPVRSGARSWGPAVPTELRRSQWSRVAEEEEEEEEGKWLW